MSPAQQAADKHHSLPPLCFLYYVSVIYCIFIELQTCWFSSFYRSNVQSCYHLMQAFVITEMWGSYIIAKENCRRSRQRRHVMHFMQLPLSSQLSLLQDFQFFNAFLQIIHLFPSNVTLLWWPFGQYIIMLHTHSTSGLKLHYNMSIILPAWWTHLQLWYRW